MTTTTDSSTAPAPYAAKFWLIGHPNHEFNAYARNAIHLAVCGVKAEEFEGYITLGNCNYKATIVILRSDVHIESGRLTLMCNIFTEDHVYEAGDHMSFAARMYVDAGQREYPRYDLFWFPSKDDHNSLVNTYGIVPSI